ncbi:MAG: sulfite exporter TauE/SafE family protein [Halofilum sp. (in: g-proteobacteria)]|nr:sulfite exporter TauE/SafE family protein [Halofilum sp. (in: g-proteobacteria)]
MIELLAGLLPPGLTAWAALVIMLCAGIGAFITAAFGLGGGVLLLGVMAAFMPVTAVIPVHGVVQLGANGWRMVLLHRAVRWPVLAAFAAGGVLGAAAGARVLVRLPGAWIELALGVFILWTCWGPRPELRRGSLARVGVGGAITSLLTLFVGATGPFVSAFLRALGLDRRAHVGTFSACMSLQHALKLVVFGLAGFAFGPWLPWLAVTFACVMIGTWLGRQVLERLDERRFRLILGLILTVLALRLVYSALTAPGMPLAGLAWA